MRVDAPEEITVMVAPEPGLFSARWLDVDDDGSVEMVESLLKTQRVVTSVPRLKLARRGD